MKKILISILIISFIMAMVTISYATTGRINLGTSSDIVNNGEKFTITIAGIADNNIIAMQTDLDYDSSKIIIEERSVGESFIDSSGENEIAIMAASNDTLSKSGTLYKVTFNVLDTAVEGEVKINFKGVTLGLINENFEDEVVNVGDQSVSITIKKEDTTVGGNQGETSEDTQTSGNIQTPEYNGNGNEDSNPSKDIDNSNTDNFGDNDSNSGNENKYTNTNKNTGKNNNKNTTKLPQTGVENLSLIVIIVLGFISIVSYISYRKYKNI